MSLPAQIPRRYRWAAYAQWLAVTVPFGICWLLTFPMGLLVVATARRMQDHPQGQPTEGQHSPGYIKAGSSGRWEYCNSPLRICRPWNNYEDGTLGEPSGKHSARCGGNERSFWNQYQWVRRNAFNWGKRTSRLFACFVNDCDIQYWGSRSITDKAPVSEGWHFCRATDRTTGRIYYGYRSVTLNDDGTVRQVNLGYKINPRHATEVQDSDDLDKAFTLRIQFASQPD